MLYLWSRIPIHKKNDHNDEKVDPTSLHGCNPAGHGPAHTHDGKDWTTPLSLQVDVELKKGNNVIRLWNDGAWLPDIDMMKLN